MDRTFVASNVVKCMFLGSKDKVVVAGDSPKATLQVLYGTDDARPDDDAMHDVHTQNLNGNCTDFELCGIGRLAKTYGAVALWDQYSAHSHVSLLDIHTSIDSAEISPLVEKLCSSTSPISSLSFSPDMEVLAVATEAGIVHVLDLHGGNTVCTIKADPAGVKQVQFSRTGQLITVGESPKCQVRVWDLRASAEGAAALSLAQELNDRDAAQGKCNTTTVCLHPVHEKLISGREDGTLQLWDLRSAASLTYRPHQHSAGE